MAVCIVEPGLLEGRLLVPPSKSMGHRALFCAALAEGSSHLDNIVLSDDIMATMDALKALGVRTALSPSSRFSGRKRVIVHGTGRPQPTGEVIDCHESGSTARFIIPVSRLMSDEVTVTGRGRLLERPFGLFRTLFGGKAVTMTDWEGRLPVTLQGRLAPGVFRLRGDVSSQFITGLLFALPLLLKDSVIEIEGPLESAPYVAMTIEMLALFGVHAEMTNEALNNQTPDSGSGTLFNGDREIGARILVPGGQHYRPMDYDVEGDWSQAAFWIVAGALGSRLALDGLRMDSLQGDRVIVDILASMGADIHAEGGSLHLGGARPTERASLRAVDMDVAQCPDLVPALSVAATFADGRSRIFNAARLRIKESDRLQAMREQLGALGANISEEPDGLVITGQGLSGHEENGSDNTPADRLSGHLHAGPLSGGSVRSCGDHRIVMACAIAATCADGGVLIDGMEAVSKSYPDFWEDFRRLGGRVHEQHVG